MQAVLSGCETATPAPSEGDVRLMTLNGTTAGTAACDEVHFGGVGMFFQGRWGRICNGRLGSDHDEFTLDAHVICRQLGFPFGTVMNEEDFFGAYEYNERAREDENVLTWASEVLSCEAGLPVAGHLCSVNRHAQCGQVLMKLHSRGSGIEGSLRLQGTTVFLLLLCVRQLSDTAGNAAPVIGRSQNCHSWPSIVSITKQTY